MDKIIIVIMIMSLIDLTATYLYVSTFHAKYPTLDYKTLEANPILRTAWDKLGLNWGMVVGGFVVFGLLTFVAFTVAPNWKWFYAGVLSMMIIYHYLNFVQLRALK